MAVKVKSAELERVSHWVELRHEKVEKETLGATFTLEIHGELVRVDATARCYRSNYGPGDDRLTPWSSHLERVRKGDTYDEPSGIGPVTRAAIREDVCAQLEAWIDTPAFKASRREAFASALRRVIVENGHTSYGLERSKRALAVFGAEITSADRSRFQRVVALQEKIGALLDGASA